MHTTKHTTTEKLSNTEIQEELRKDSGAYMTQISFTKMNGLGNDFIIIDYDEFLKTGKDKADLAKLLCNRNFSIGADGLIILNPNTKETDIGWYFYNSDGSIAQMCGNGMRCFSKYVYEKGFVNKKSFSVETKAGVIKPQINNDGTVTVNMSKPILNPEKIPVKVKNNLNFDVQAGDKIFTANAVSMGNPHCIIFTEEDTKALAPKYGPYIETSNLFPEKTNVEFIKVVSRNEINLDVWERGCGITLACGTGACASAVAGILNELLDNKVKVNLPGGVLFIEWNGDKTNTDCDVFMTGNADLSFKGTVDII